MSLASRLSDFATRIATEIKSVRTLINGNTSSLSGLNTTAKSNLVSSINEVLALAQNAGAKIDDATKSALTVWSSNKTDSQIQAAVATVVASSPAALDTLNELAAALGNDPSFATTITNTLATKAPINNASFTGTHTVPDGSFTVAKTTGLQSALDSKIPAFADPDGDRILFWDDSESSWAALNLIGLAISGTNLSVNSATDTAQGIIELATLTEVATGTDTVRAVTPAGVAQQIATRAATTHSHTTSQITDYASATDSRINTLVPGGTTSVAGKLQLATLTEVGTGTDTAKAVTAAGVAQQIATRAATSHTHTASQITDFSSAADSRINTLVPQATTTAAGKIQIATLSEVSTGTDTAKAVTAQGVAQQIATRAASTHTHTASQITDFVSAIPVGSESTQGKLQLASLTEAGAGTDTAKAITAAGLAQQIATRAATTHSHTASQISDFNSATDARVNGLVPSASTTAAGKVFLATLTQVSTGTDTATAVTPEGVAQQIATRAATSHSHTASQITDFASAADTRVNALVPSATTTVVGKVMLATDAVTLTGTSIVTAVTPASLRSITGDPDTNFVSVFEAALAS